MTRAELAQEIYKISYLQGEFKLRSGTVSNEYFDKYRFESQPNVLKNIAIQLAPLIPKGTDVLAGLELGGVPIATALSLYTGLPVVFVRKSAKEYGTCQFAEGLDVKGKQVCIIEDVITTGGQVVLSAQDLRGLGAKVDHVLCAILRGKKDEPKIKELNLQVHPLFEMAELKNS